MDVTVGAAVDYMLGTINIPGVTGWITRSTPSLCRLSQVVMAPSDGQAVEHIPCDLIGSIPKPSLLAQARHPIDGCGIKDGAISFLKRHHRSSIDSIVVREVNKGCGGD